MSAKSNLREFTKGIIRENPTLILLLGTCPTIAISKNALDALGMGIAASFVLICSNAVISALRKVIPDSVRIPAFITVIASFVSVVQMVVKAYVPSLDKALGVFLPLIVVNCIILARAEVFASKNKIIPSLLDGAGMGLGFTLAITTMGIIRELLGSGTVFGIAITKSFMSPIGIFTATAGGFFVYGILIATVSRLAKRKNPENLCDGCPSASICSMSKKEGKVHE
ncbi:MAG: electron transport complex subunit E [Clostridiales bacterium]|jgi:electron transport complex protein RnfE|nr:electron transport complex subunit E [Clostridiales bacterium]